MITKLYVDVTNYLNELKNDEQGVTAIEYGLIAVAMAALLAIVLTDSTGFVANLRAAFGTVASEITNAQVTPGGGS